MTSLMTVHHTTILSPRKEGRKRQLWGGSGQQLWEDDQQLQEDNRQDCGGWLCKTKVEEWWWQDATINCHGEGQWWVTRLHHKDSPSNNIGGAGGCRDGGRWEEDSYVNEVVLEATNKEEAQDCHMCPSLRSWDCSTPSSIWFCSNPLPASPPMHPMPLPTIVEKQQNPAIVIGWGIRSVTIVVTQRQKRRNS